MRQRQRQRLGPELQLLPPAPRQQASGQPSSGASADVQPPAEAPVGSVSVKSSRVEDSMSLRSDSSSSSSSSEEEREEELSER